ncbi:16S rRNA (cytidine(1402)-2'-O)-methyltransferase [Jannaschia seohaensis]|uniref:Ribosomal RNA small subunit methyltransferase I n=1 Tax=Jannaschia seohaensis TaxID=475081 RepID=A0A2Y9ASX5_9RHOB|nr:16S rRNA (cytidine(1402)-2'-O)-methyltransferase [Jannaschia seohaensis]PWJ17421.1 16S rRNA (cytidine1402-2'-O)-methyltransferase [Jannaschia seohaensis]SSA47484.1 16S rRNA (cytidine1402-2'-O)-methyltransferase [Jannaschia seohaensis]
MAEESGIEPGLYLVAVPIGAARDITLHALDLLRGADIVAAEDTRSLRRLMEIHGVPLGERPLIPYHDHNGERVRPRLLAALREGRSVAYASEAGTPLIADPGFQLGAAARAAGVPVRAAPGASAVLTALCVGGLPTDRFTFAGFLPPKRAARRAALSELAAAPGTLVLYEAPRRLGALLADAAELFGDRRAAVCRELTKRFEEVVEGTLPELADRFAGEPPRGEIVVLIDRAAPAETDQGTVENMLRDALETMSLKSAVKDVSQRAGVARNLVYEMALRMRDGG